MADAGGYLTTLPKTVESMSQDYGSQLAQIDQYRKTPIARYVVSENKEIVVASVDVATGTFTSIGHGYAANEQVIPLLDAADALDYPIKYMPTGLTPIRYYIKVVTDDTFQVSLTSGGAAVTFTTNAAQDLTKWHFETVLRALSITSLGARYKARITIRGKIPNIDYVLPYNTTGSDYLTDTFFKSNSTTFTYPKLSATGSCWLNLEVLIDSLEAMTINYKGFSTNHNTASANTLALIDVQCVSPIQANILFDKITFSGVYLSNGTVIEVFAA